VPHTTSQPRGVFEAIMVISMTVGRGAAAREIASIAGIAAGDRLVDVGCGPGTAVREAARRGAAATGVDPVPAMLRIARWISTRRHAERVTWLDGSAEALPVPDGAATIVWAISSLHHWSDQAAGLGEARRVLGPSGRLLIAERLVPRGGRGHAAHGLTREQAGELALAMAAAGFAHIRALDAQAGRRHLIIVQATAEGPAAPDQD
jgi:ubiquinone/menaquinone biosynthesis C-methylase UbiE